MPTIAELQSQVDGVLKRPRARATMLAEGPASVEPQARPFSGFYLPDVQRAQELASEWMERAEEVRHGGAGSMTDAVGSALEAAQGAVTEMEDAPDEDANLARFAVKLFLTHYRHELPLQIQSLEQRAPELVLPSGNGAVPEGYPEEALRWFREDPKQNEHHEHWHVVYPISGIPAPNSRKGKTKERQGELFLYMHRQMLARYEAERLAVGLPPLVPWGYSEAEPYGYDPGPYLWNNYGPRQPNMKWGPTQEGSYTVQVQEMAERGKRLFEAAKSGYFEMPGSPKIAVTADLLGRTLEADIGSVETGIRPWDPTEKEFVEWYNDLIKGYYGNFHNVGHDMFGALSRNAKGEPQEGVMGFVPTATRDHVFFRWHKLIDEINETWQDRQPPHNFAADAPPVTMRKNLPGKSAANASPDIILCLKSELVPWDRWDVFGKLAFGGQNWDSEFAAGTFQSPSLPTAYTTTDHLITEMHDRVITIETGEEDPEHPEAAHVIEYLDQQEFFYFFRLQNESSEEQKVTVRVFLVPTPFAEERHLWIEMDKFRQDLKAKEKAVVFRPASLASVIRKPAVKPPVAEQPPVRASSDRMQESAEIGANYCDCGWPYNLLLPRGTSEGMPFRLLVMLTDWNVDNVPQEGDCGSMSYCGSRDKYPDTRPMGYPFDAPFSQPIAKTVAATPNMATRDITIRWGA